MKSDRLVLYCKRLYLLAVGLTCCAQGITGSGGEAFREMGTNAVPFLASRIKQDLGPTLFERVASKLPKRLQPKSTDRRFEAWSATMLLAGWIKPPESMLREMLKPALLGTNQYQKDLAEFALRGSVEAIGDKMLPQ